MIWSVICITLLALLWLVNRKIKKDTQRIIDEFCEEERQRLEDEPCGHCNRWSECNGIDKDNCPLYEAEKDIWQ